MAPELIIRGRRVVQPDTTRPAAIHIRNGVIAAIGAYEDLPSGCPVVDAGDSVVMPGLVDTHVHINEPGRTEWEGFQTATRAAAAGGVTTLVEMPLNSIPATTTVKAFRDKLEAAQGQCWVDVGFWGGVVPGNALELRHLYGAGVFGFKCFLVPSGVDEFPHVTESDLREAMPELAAMGALLLAHSEMPGPIEKALERSRTGQNACPTKYSTWLASRPREAEHEAISLLIRLCREFGARVHVVHLSSSDALGMLRQARADGLPLSVETCPHYLTFAAEGIPDGATQFKCAPPVREGENRERLWGALGEKLIDLVVTDHSPCPPAMKCGESGDFLRAWGGISSLQFSLPVMWTQARQRGSSFQDLAEWMCRAPAHLAGLDQRKGAIRVGYDADLVVWNPEVTFRVDTAMILHRHKLTPYAGLTLSGMVEMTYLRGRKTYDRGEFSSELYGAILKRDVR